MATTTLDQLPPANALERAGLLFNEVATLARQMDRACYFGHGTSVEDRNPEEVQLELDRLRAALCRIGWMADLGAGVVGGPIALGGAEKWLLPTSIDKLSEVTHAA